MGEQTAGVTWTSGRVTDAMVPVHSFGCRHDAGCANGCCPPTVSIVLGVNGEVEQPQLLTLQIGQMEALILALQREISLARGEKVH